MRIIVAVVLLLASTFGSTAVAGECSRFTGSTMTVDQIEPARWRTDYPGNFSSTPADKPWEQIDFAVDPEGYLNSILTTVTPAFKMSSRRLVATDEHQWWATLWLDYTTSGREPLMGLTKERGPDAGDLSPWSADTYQVWAVGFYNAAGASSLADVFADPCEPVVPAGLTFPDGTASVKFLFTDADPHAVSYLHMAPEYDAFIDPPGAPPSVSGRVKRTVRLLQVDVAVKDPDAVTGWVFGTFGWVGPTKGDGLFDNLVPVSLQWGNDPKVYSQAGVTQSWVNPAMAGVMYGWADRPTLGYMGRANGPADNIRSSCLSCHAAARAPRSQLGLLGFNFDMAEVTDPARVKSHVDTWFENIVGGELFDPPPTGDSQQVIALDYSLQLEASIWRMCRACNSGDLSGATPRLCIATGHFIEEQCTVLDPTNFSQNLRNLDLQNEVPPRQ